MDYVARSSIQRLRRSQITPAIIPVTMLVMEIAMLQPREGTSHRARLLMATDKRTDA